MKLLMKSLVLAAFPAIALNAQAEVSQDCILEGEVNQKKAAAMQQNAYVRFYSATDGSTEVGCNMRKGKRIVFKQAKEDGIQNLPDGAVVTYHYTEGPDQQAQWRLLDVQAD